MRRFFVVGKRRGGGGGGGISHATKEREQEERHGERGRRATRARDLARAKEKEGHPLRHGKWKWNGAERFGEEWRGSRAACTTACRAARARARGRGLGTTGRRRRRTPLALLLFCCSLLYASIETQRVVLRVEKGQEKSLTKSPRPRMRQRRSRALVTRR